MYAVQYTATRIYVMRLQLKGESPPAEAKEKGLYSTA